MKAKKTRAVYTTLKDSGMRSEFNTGAVRDLSTGKGRFDLLPALVLERLAVHYENGAKKYADRNWEQGIPIRSFVDSGLRHFNKWLQGENAEDHLSAIIWNVAGIIWTIDKIEKGERPTTLLDNLPEELRKRWNKTETEPKSLPKMVKKRKP